MFRLCREFDRGWANTRTHTTRTHTDTHIHTTKHGVHGTGGPRPARADTHRRPLPRRPQHRSQARTEDSNVLCHIGCERPQGARKPNSEQDWAVSDYHWSDGSPVEYHNFPPTLPDNQFGKEDKCGIMALDGTGLIGWISSGPGSWNDVQSTTEVTSAPHWHIRHHNQHRRQTQRQSRFRAPLSIVCCRVCGCAVCVCVCVCVHGCPVCVCVRPWVSRVCVCRLLPGPVPV